MFWFEATLNNYFDYFLTRKPGYFDITAQMTWKMRGDPDSKPLLVSCIAAT